MKILPTKPLGSVPGVGDTKYLYSPFPMIVARHRTFLNIVSGLLRPFYMLVARHRVFFNVMDRQHIDSNK